MSRTALIQTARQSAALSRPRQPMQKSASWIELSRQRARLLVSLSASLTADGESNVGSDLADQASAEFELDFAMQVRSRTFDKLRRIERALQLMRTCGYGQCRHCREDIPYDRLTVQPDACFCVPCLTIVEQEAARN